MVQVKRHEAVGAWRVQKEVGGVGKFGTLVLFAPKTGYPVHQLLVRPRLPLLGSAPGSTPPPAFAFGGWACSALSSSLPRKPTIRTFRCTSYWFYPALCFWIQDSGFGV